MKLKYFYRNASFCGLTENAGHEFDECKIDGPSAQV